MRQALKGAATRQYKNVISRCQEIAESPVYDPDDMDIIKEYRKAYKAQVEKYMEVATVLEPKLKSEDPKKYVKTMEDNMVDLEEDMEAIRDAVKALITKKEKEEMDRPGPRWSG